MQNVTNSVRSMFITLASEYAKFHFADSLSMDSVALHFPELGNIKYFLFEKPKFSFTPSE